MSGYNALHQLWMEEKMYYLGNIALYGSTLALSWEGCFPLCVSCFLHSLWLCNVFPWGVRWDVRAFRESSWRWRGLIDEEQWRCGEQRCQESDVSSPFLKLPWLFLTSILPIFLKFWTFTFNVRYKKDRFTYTCPFVHTCWQFLTT